MRCRRRTAARRSNKADACAKAPKGPWCSTWRPPSKEFCTQRIAILRHVESLRLYAAEHGKFPATLSELWTPLPVDPMNSQPLQYESDGTTAHLRGSAP